MPQLIGHPQNTWLPNTPGPFPFNPFFHHQTQRMSVPNVDHFQGSHHNKERGMMTPHFAVVNPFNCNLPEECVTTVVPPRELIENAHPMTNQQLFNDSFRPPIHFQHHFQTEESSLKAKMPLNVGDQTPFLLNTEPSKQQELPLFDGSDESTVVDTPQQPHRDHFLNGKPDLKNSNHDSSQPTTIFHSQQFKLENTRPDIKQSNDEFKSDSSIPRVYSVDELEKSFFQSDITCTNHSFPKVGEHLSKTKGICKIRLLKDIRFKLFFKEATVMNSIVHLPVFRQFTIDNWLLLVIVFF
jgi:hypothetical protein